MSLLQSIFGPSLKKVYAEVAAETGGDLVESGWLIWKRYKVVRRLGAWTTTLDYYRKVVGDGEAATSYVITRMRPPLVNRDGFQFTVYRRSIFTGIAKLLGMQDVQVGHDGFDRAFVVKTNDESKVKQLFQNNHIRDSIEEQGTVVFEFRGTVEFELSESALQFEVKEDVQDVKRLKDLFDLFDETLHTVFGK